MKAHLAEQERETFVAAPFLTNYKKEIAIHFVAEERGLLHDWHGPSWKKHGAFLVLAFEAKNRNAPHFQKKIGVRV
jgi:hypothetical protein